MIDVEDLVFDAPWGRVLHGVGFVVRSGAVLGLVGPPGAGKSTLLRCIATLETPERGRISVVGLDAQRQPREVHAALGYVASTFGLYDALSVRRCLTYAARARGVPAAEAAQAAEAAAAEVGLVQGLDAPASALSDSGRHRLAIGQAVAHGPRVLLLDEPAAGLGPAAREPLAAMVARFAARGMTVVMSAPTLAELPAGCTDLLALEDGRVDGPGVVRLAETAAPPGPDPSAPP